MRNMRLTRVLLNENKIKVLQFSILRENTLKITNKLNTNKPGPPVFQAAKEKSYLRLTYRS